MRSENVFSLFNFLKGDIRERKILRLRVIVARRERARLKAPEFWLVFERKCEIIRALTLRLCRQTLRSPFVSIRTFSRKSERKRRA